MKRFKFSITTTLFMLLVMVSIAQALTITTYTDFSLWKSNAGNYNLMDFKHGDLGDLEFISSTGHVQGNHFRDRVVDGLETEWFVPGEVFSAFGADWNLLPDMIGKNLSFTFYGVDNSVVKTEIPGFYYGFLGFITTDPFIKFVVGEGSVIGGLSETYHMDNVVYSTVEPVPEPGTMLLFGTGLAALASIRRKRK